MMKAVAIILMFLLPLICEATPGWKDKTENADYIHRSIKKVTDVIVFDIYSPPVASRTYAYICIAGYEAVINGNPAFLSLAGQLNELKSAPAPEPGKEYSFTLASVNAILLVGKALVISEASIEAFKSKIQQEFKDNGIPPEVFKNSVDYGQKIASHILAWAANDNYKQTRSLAKYAVSDDPSTWKPTPPAYIKAIEPSWNIIRTFLMDSAQQFRPAPPPAFSYEKNSSFYGEALAVRNAGNNLSTEQREIANFWDCNPFKMNVRGHVMYATKKISPGGHWINITRLACKKISAGPAQSAEAYARLSITLADCFISCWDEKYRSQVIRPETYINQYIDTNWVPLLQTPPFPEYTSGHSVVSSAASVVLSNLFGEKFSYTDSTEFEFGLPARSFQSFKQAAEEAAISRFYGGIHYMSAINQGFKEGTQVGVFVTRILKTRRT